MKKIKVGDIFEITTPQGNAYLHYIFKDSEIGELIRILPGLYSERPANLDPLAGAQELCLIFFPLTAAHKKQIVEIVGSYSSEKFDRPKYMRTEHIVYGEFLGWHIIETSTWKRKFVKKLDLAQKQLSPWGIWNDTLLVEKLVNNWTLEKWM
jgi:hypothetical protein